MGNEKSQKIVLFGDINLMGMHDPYIPFEKVKNCFDDADIKLANLECCFFDCDVVYNEINSKFRCEGLYAATNMVEALKQLGISGVGTANNVNFGTDAVLSSVKCLDDNGIKHTGSGKNIMKAMKPIQLKSNGLRVGMVQKSCLYWPVNHEARFQFPGISVLKVHTAYRPRIDERAVEKPGTPPEVITWCDPRYLDSFIEQIKSMKGKNDIVIASIHWGLEDHVVSYQTDIAHALIDAGADIIMGHGTHRASGFEIYKKKSIFYSLGHFYFNIGHCATEPGNWVGLVPIITIEKSEIVDIEIAFAMHTFDKKTEIVSVKQVEETFHEIEKISASFNTFMEVSGDRVKLIF